MLTDMLFCICLLKHEPNEPNELNELYCSKTPSLIGSYAHERAFLYLNAQTSINTLTYYKNTLHKKVLCGRDMTQNHKNRWSMTKIWLWAFYKVCPPHTPFPIIKDRRLCRPKSSCTFPMGYGGGGGHTLEKPQGQIFVLDHLYTWFRVRFLG